ncbi:MAG: apolipoprotein N-acyltransferase [Pseudomonadota bacterium]
MKLFLTKLGLGLLLGFVCSYAMAPYNFWPLMLLSLAGLFTLIHSAKNLKRAFIYSFAFTYGYFTLSLSWVGNALLVDNNPYAWAYPLALLGAPLLISWVIPVFITLYKRFYITNHLTSPLAFAGSITLAEWIRGTFVFDGFPWNNFGYAWVDKLEIAQIIVLDNIYLLTLLSALWAGFIGLAFLEKKKRTLSLIIVLITFLSSYSFGAYRLITTDITFDKTAHFKIIQPNIAQADKWDTQKFEENFSKHIHLSRPTKALEKNTTTYIIWPETSLTYRHTNDQRALYLYQSVLEQYEGEAYVISGFMRFLPEENKVYNSIAVLDRDFKLSGIYDKHHLVPFGEYIPFQSYIPIETVTRFSGFVRGDGPTRITLPSGHSYSPLICYESIFPNKVIANPLRPPDFMLNVANDAWYGDSAGPHQHFIQGQFRAIEQGIPFIRATSTGISGVVDPLGRVIKKSKLNEGISLETDLPKKISSTKLPYFLKGKIFLILCLLFLSTALFIRLTQRK